MITNHTKLVEGERLQVDWIDPQAEYGNREYHDLHAEGIYVGRARAVGPAKIRYILVKFPSPISIFLDGRDPQEIMRFHPECITRLTD